MDAAAAVLVHDSFRFHPKLAHCTQLLKEQVLSQVTRHSKLNINRCSFPMEKKNLKKNAVSGLSSFFIRIQHTTNTSR